MTDHQLLELQLQPKVGHAIQDHQGYWFLRFRAALVPVANLGSSLSYMIIMLGIILTAIGCIWFNCFMDWCWFNVISGIIQLLRYQLSLMRVQER